MSLPLWTESLGKYREVPGTIPLKVRMDVTNKCNLQCKMCFYRDIAHLPKNDISPELFDKICRNIFPHCDRIVLSCQYEPFMHKDFPSMLRKASQVNPAAKIGFVSNATLWTDEGINTMINTPNLESIAVSIDGGTKETYESIRVNAKWDVVINNLRKFARAKEIRGGGLAPGVQINTVLMKSTIAELPLLVRLAAEVNAFQLTAIRFLPVNKELDEAIEDWEPYMPILIEAANTAKQLGLPLVLPIDDKRLPTPAPLPPADIPQAPAQPAHSPWCDAPWSLLMIDPNGDLRPCGYITESVGNLNDTDFEELWNCKTMLKLRQQLAHMKLSEQCKHCNPHNYEVQERDNRNSVRKVR
ncbi:radical SAM protein [Candidatus Sumerlaeota bacterium]|nr:radical SAM protein [Candidatus Sumerlaeota bacterium]